MPATLARLLVEGGVFNRAVADECLRRHLQVGGGLDTVVLEGGHCKEDVLLAYLAQASGLPAALPAAFARPDPKIFSIFPFKLADRHGMVPIELGRRHLDVATCYPVEQMLLEELSFMLGRDLRPQIAVEARIREAIARLYNKPLAPRFQSLVLRLGPAPAALPDLVDSRSVAPKAPASEAMLGKAAKVGTIASWPPVDAAPPPSPARPLAQKLAPVPAQLLAPVPQNIVAPPPERPKSDELPILEATPLAEPEPMVDARAPALEEDAAALLPSEPPPEPARPATIEIEIVVEPEQPAAPANGAVPSAAQEPATLEMPAVTGEEDVRVGDDPLVAPEPQPTPEPAPAPVVAAGPPPLPSKRPTTQKAGLAEPTAQPAPVPEPAAALAPEPAPAPPAPAPEAATAPEEKFEIEEVPPIIEEPPPPQPGDGPSQTPATRRAWETRDKLTAWRPAADGLAGLEDVLAQVLGDVDPSLFAQEVTQNAAAAHEAAVSGLPAAPLTHGTGWALSEARAHLAAAPERDAIIEVALRFALKSFDFAAALAVRAGTAFGWTALTSDGAVHNEVRRLALPLDAPSVLRTVLRARGRYLGPLPDDELTRAMLADLGREAPTVALLYPVYVRERPVALFYADRGRKHVSAARVAEFLLFAQELATAFERAILAAKQRGLQPVAVAPPLPAPKALAPEPPPAEEEALFPIDETEPVYERKERPLEEVMLDLLAPDRRKRLAAIAELEALPEQAAPALAARFPGPTALRRGLVIDLPEPEELGPIVWAMARLGEPAFPFIDRLLRDGDPDQRFFAVLLAGSLKKLEFFPALRQALFDQVNEVATAARAAAARVRGVAGFEDGVARHLREELGSPDPERVASASLAIGRIRDERAIPLLIPLTGHADDRVAAEASDALTEITKQTHGDSPRRWQSWWEQNRTRPRIAWLVEGLAHKDLQVRLSSIEELVALTNDSLGYLADGPRREREKALERWDLWLKQKLH